MTRPASAILSDLAAVTERQAALQRELASALAAPPARPVAASAGAEPTYATPDEAARILGVSTRTLATQRAAGTGPAFVRIGRCVRYPFHGLSTQGLRAPADP